MRLGLDGIIFMEIFADTSEIQEIKLLQELRLIDGITTNPTIFFKNNTNEIDFIKEILKIVDCSIHIHVIGDSVDEVVKKANDLAKISDQIVIKLPITSEYIRSCAKLSAIGIPINITLCFSQAQALVAAKAGASYVSVFVGRLDDIGVDGISILNDCCAIWQNYPEITTKLIAASVRNQNHILAAAKLGIDIVTAHPKVIRSMLHHELTDIGIKTFNNDYSKIGRCAL